jgi:UDP-2,3-diacylglucosamine pyrophosphatase LpxH
LRFGGYASSTATFTKVRKGRYLVIHGDAFDAVTQNSKLVAVVGDIGYQSLLKLNRIYNRYRTWRGKPYFSLSKAIKAHAKSVVNYISRFEDQIETFAKKHNCIGFICGHIHTPENKMIGPVHYLNSGDWIESNTALVEYPDGKFEVLQYEDFCQRLARENEKSFPFSPVSEAPPEPAVPTTWVNKPA